jgi:putative pyruvate formate lyase activating enzyme
MDQYFPSYKAYKYPEIDRRITKEEFEEAIRAAHDEGLYRLDKADVL